MDELTVTRWPNLLNTHGERYTLTWERLGKLLTTRRPFEGDRQHSGWSPASFRGDRRGLEHVESVYALCLDYDRGEALDDVLERFPGMDLVLHTTRKHTPSEPRCRVVIRLSRAVSPGEFSDLWRRFAPIAGEVDQAPKDPSRFWFTPGCPDGAEFVGRVVPGEPLDVDHWLAKPDPSRRTEPPSIPEPERLPIIDRARAYVAKMPGATAGSGGHLATWHVAIVLAKGFELDERQTLDVLREYNKRCEPEWSEKELAHKAKQAQSAAVPRGFVLDRDRPWSPAARRTVEEVETDHSWVDDLAGESLPEEEDLERAAIQGEKATKKPSTDDDRATRLHFEDDIIISSIRRATTIENEPKPIMTTGHYQIDDDTGGYEKEFCWVIGADTSWGKSSLAIMTYDLNVARGFRPLIVSFEDAEKLYADRLTCRRARIHPGRYKKVRRGHGTFTTEEIAALSRVARDATHRPTVLDARGRSVEWAAKRLSRLVKDQEIDLVMVDYLQAAENERTQQDRRVQLTYIARTITDAIKTSGAAGILYSQITVSEHKKIPDRHSIKESRDASNAAETVALGFIQAGDTTLKDGTVIKDGTKCLFVDKVKDGPPKKMHAMNWNDDLAFFEPVLAGQSPERAGYFPDVQYDNEFEDRHR